MRTIVSRHCTNEFAAMESHASQELLPEDDGHLCNREFFPYILKLALERLNSYVGS